MDYSEKLISIAKKVFAKNPLDELILGEAINLPTDIKYDSVISCGVFHYFPDLKYAETVMEKMTEKSAKSVGIINIHDADKEAAFLKCRREITPNYDELYKDLPKLFFTKKFFEDFAKKHNLDIEITLLPLEGFWDNDFLFDVFMYKR